MSSWIQVILSFCLGGLCPITSWMYSKKFHLFFATIFEIDEKLKSFICDLHINYCNKRRTMMRKLCLLICMPLFLSMVNCTILKSSKIDVMTFCYWFLCFLPFTMTCFKQFQFCNLLNLIKEKLEFINRELSHMSNCPKLNKTREPLTTPLIITVQSHLKDDFKNDNMKISNLRIPYVNLEELMHIFSVICDALELLMDIFSWYLLMLTSLIFGSITVEIYNVIVILLMNLNFNIYQVTLLISWILALIYILICNVNLCSKTNYEVCNVFLKLNRCN